MTREGLGRANRPRRGDIHALSRGDEFGLIPQDHAHAAFQADELLRSQLAEAALTVLPNSGEGNRCLYQAMLQAASVVPEHVAGRAVQLETELSGRDDALGRAVRARQGLYADAQVFHALAAHIFGVDAIPPMLVITAGEHGAPVLYDPLRRHDGPAVDIAAVALGTLVFLETPGHFQMVANTSGQPWPMVLQQVAGPPVSRVDGVDAALDAPVPDFGLDPAGQPQAHAEAAGLLRGRLPGVGLTLVPNAGTGHERLIHAMLQVSGVAPDAVAARAFQVQGRLAGRPDAAGHALREGLSLYADPQVFEAVAAEIFAAGGMPPVLIMMADAHGVPLMYDPLQRLADITAAPARTAVFLDLPGQLEWVANTSGRKWAALLAQLQLAPHEPAEDPGRLWLQHCIRALQPMEVRVSRLEGRPMQAVQSMADPGGMAFHGRVHQWKRGLQTQLVLRGHGAAPPDAAALGEAQAAVDDFWTALEQWGSCDLGQAQPAGEGLETFRLGVTSPGRPDGLRHDGSAGDLAALAAGESHFRYVAHVTIRQGRLIQLIIERPGSAIAVGFEHPWARTLVRRADSRERLGHPDDLDDFDEFLLKPHPESQPGDPSRFAAFLLDVRANGNGRTWRRLRDTPGLCEGYLREAVAARRIHQSVPATVRRAMDQQGTAQRNLARRRLFAQDDLDAYDDFAHKPRAAAHGNDPARFATFLVHLRASAAGMNWETFRKAPEDERDRILADAVAQGQLNESGPAAIRRAVDLATLAPPNDWAAYAEFAGAGRSPSHRRDLVLFASFLLHLRQRGIGVEWEQFRDAPEPWRQGFLTEAVADGFLNEEAPAAVSRAIPRPARQATRA